MRYLAIIQPKLHWLLLVPLIFIPRLLNLDVFLTADEPLFLTHARQFAVGMSTGNFSQTLGIGYPGVTVAGWAAPVVNLTQSDMGAYAAGRVVTALLTGLLLVVLYRLAYLLLGRWPAFVGVALLALDPYSLAYSRLLHIAAPLALFMALAGVSLLLWLRYAYRRWLLLTGLFTGLALLTKSTALLLAPMLGAAVLGWGLSTGRWRSPRWWLRVAGGLLLAGGVAVAIFFILWPAMWVDPTQALTLTFGKLFRDQEAGAGNLGLFWLGRFVQDPGPLFYPVAFLLKSTPWLLVGLLLNLTYCVLHIPFLNNLNTQHATRNTQHASHSNYQLPATLSLWLFALTYLAIMTIASKKSIRYMLPAFPVFYLLAGLALYQTVGRIRHWKAAQKTPFPNLPISHASRPHLPISSLFLLLFLVLFTFFYHPYYFTYYNPLLLGWRWAPQTLLVGWGEGLDGAARYLNNQPNGSVSAWYEWLFSIMYNGPVQPVVPQENLITADHTVLYINQVQRDIPGPNIIHYFRTRRRPEHTVRLAGIDYAWVYPGPIAGFGADPQPQHPLGGQFGGEAQLLGYNLHPQPAAGGNSLIVTLFWRVLSTPAADRFVYLRLVDAQGHIWATADSPPVMGLWPVGRWQPDMLIEDAHALPIPAGTPPGSYRLEVGLYNPASGQPLAATGQPLGQGGGLLLGQVPVAWRALPADVDLPNQTDARLSPDINLMGYSAPPPTATTGDIIPVQLGWRKTGSGTAAIDGAVFEWCRAEQCVATPPSPLPLPVGQWERGATLLSRHDVIVPPALESGRYNLQVLLHQSGQPAGKPLLLGNIDVTAPPHQFDLPADAALPAGPAQLAAGASQTVTLAGYNLDVAEQALDLHLYWSTSAPLTTPHKVFAQLLAADNTLAAQSDSVPAQGQRPTTGWLPGEIVTDPHRLPLAGDLPAGTYRLIAGLYNPSNGQRLPLLNESGQSIGDAVFITEVTLP